MSSSVPQEIHMNMNRIVMALMTGCAAVVISAVPGFAAQATTPEHQHAAMEKAKPASSMDAKCQAMMADHETMMTQMNAADQKLDGLVAKMNNASAAEMPAATATVVNEMATQRRAMRDGMMKMQEGMMAHMIGTHAGGAGLDGLVPDDEAAGRKEALTGGRTRPIGRA
jgi:hypothetical protein